LVIIYAASLPFLCLQKNPREKTNLADKIIITNFILIMRWDLFVFCIWDKDPRCVLYSEFKSNYLANWAVKESEQASRIRSAVAGHSK
jgi:hypothetical protein